MVLHGNEFRPAIHSCGQLQFCELPGEHGGGAKVQHLTGLAQVMQGFEHLFNGHRHVKRQAMGVAVNHEVIDVFHAEPLQ